MMRLQIFCRRGLTKFFVAVSALTITAAVIYVDSPFIVLNDLRRYTKWFTNLKTAGKFDTNNYKVPVTEFKTVRKMRELKDRSWILRGNKYVIITNGRENVLKAVSERHSKGIETPTILVWRSQRHLENERQKHLEFLLGSQCGGCQVTMDRYALNESVAVVLFNLPEIKKDKDIPDQRTRRPGQHYVFWTRETPSKTYSYREAIEDEHFDTLFNLTMYFRHDSDIVSYFGNKESALRLSKDKESRGKLNFTSKTKSVAWLVSNCYPMYGAVERMRYAKKLAAAGLKIDKFGTCFGKQYPSSLSLANYKFYLSFENSIHCPDYVSEKFWRNGLQAGLVPIVFGPLKSDVEAVAPSRSFIHVDDFNSPKDLVDYIHYLDFNNTAYMEYHQWRNGKINEKILKEDITSGHESSFCRLCRRITVENHPPKKIPSVSKWLYKTRYVDDLCLKPKYDLTDVEKQKLTNF